MVLSEEKLLILLDIATDRIKSLEDELKRKDWLASYLNEELAKYRAEELDKLLDEGSEEVSDNG